VNPFATLRRVRRILSLPIPLGADLPPAAAEGGAHPGSSEPPHAVEPGAPQPDTTMAPIDAEVALRWRDALALIADNPCSNGDAALACPDEFGSERKRRWCSYCTAYDALNPPTPSSPADSAPGGEAARPGPPHGDVGGPGRATNSPQEK
jgi:hypothetical protein